MSTTWPSPVRSRWRSATITVNAPASAVTSSVSAIGGSSGAPSGSPLIAANPLIASAIVAKPGRPAYGPSWPKPVTRRMTSPGFRSSSSTGSSPSRSSVPGRKFSIEHVGRVDQPAHRVEPGLGLEVQHRGPLAPAEQLPHEGLAVAGIDPAHAPGAVAGRALDLDHVGAEVGQIAGHSGPRQHGRHVHDPESLECLHSRQDRKRFACLRPRTPSTAVPAPVHAAARSGRSSRATGSSSARTSPSSPSRPRPASRATTAPATAGTSASSPGAARAW